MRFVVVAWGLSLFVAGCSEPDAGSSPGSESGATDDVTHDDDGHDDDTRGEPACVPAERTCNGDDVRVCAADGSGWSIEPCPASSPCVAGSCAAIDLVVTTEILPVGEVGSGYAHALAASGGSGAYTWTLGVGALPNGLTLADTGMLSGVPEEAGVFAFEAIVTDSDDATAARELALFVDPQPLTIVTPPDLGAFDEGIAMSRQLLAIGGTPPYGWFVVDGALPAGVFVDGAGALVGTPTEHGLFEFRMRVTDVQRPPGIDELDMQLHVDLRPLEIVGDQIVDLIVTKVVTLPLMVIVPGVPVPYATQLEATGGLVPYTWNEEPIPQSLTFLFPTSGVPEGLTLNADGSITGSVTSTDDVITVGFPPLQLTGFFFFARVTDSQNPADTAEGVFLIPTVPL